MILIDEAPLAASELPLDALRAQLRLGTGFADASLQDGVLEGMLRASLAQVEALTGKAVLRRGFVWSLHAWRQAGRAVLPRAPLASFEELAIVEGSGARWVVAPEDYHVETGLHAPSIVAKGFALPRIGRGQRAELRFTAGYGAWDAVPGDLAAAVLALAAARYDERTCSGEVPAGVAALLVPYRAPRLWRAA